MIVGGLVLGVLLALVAPSASATQPDPKTEALRDTLRAWTQLQRNFTAGLRLAQTATDDLIAECDTKKIYEADNSDPDWPSTEHSAGEIVGQILIVDDMVDFLDIATKRFPDTAKSLNVVRRNRVSDATSKIKRSLRTMHASLFKLTFAPGVIRRDHDCATARVHRDEAQRIGANGYPLMVEGWQTLARIAGLQPPRPGDIDP